MVHIDPTERGHLATLALLLAPHNRIMISCIFAYDRICEAHEVAGGRRQATDRRSQVKEAPIIIFFINDLLL